MSVFFTYDFTMTTNSNSQSFIPQNHTGISSNRVSVKFNYCWKFHDCTCMCIKRESNCAPITICSSRCIVTLTVDTKMNSTHFWPMRSLCVKFHDDRCNGRQLWDRNILPNQASTDRRIEGQCDSSITPLTSLQGITIQIVVAQRGNFHLHLHICGVFPH